MRHLTRVGNGAESDTTKKLFFAERGRINAGKTTLEKFSLSKDRKGGEAKRFGTRQRGLISHWVGQ